MNFKTRELRFGLTDKSKFNEQQVKAALRSQGFPDVQVKSGTS
jgi:hypothetical protein